MDYYRLVKRPFWITIGSRSNDFCHWSWISRVLGFLARSRTIQSIAPFTEQANFVRLTANAEAYKSISMQSDPATTLFVLLA
jgi:hypothetical protein